ncbi:type 1 glutamine amidotransferase domain-containing protein [Clostridium sp. Cult2]|uniref:type 1 glutamine amidotransferase domain-containing protein n=1 Tax=Clostridium sp. Cult2 TaxID=2079003 RepID=UPI001F2449C5|nr:type 1 glutamine amidotransferase domain-containing protein [Clostridium sp. Cult2]MCF6465533.1 protease [Clostridium sp. Cult2]
MKRIAILIENMFDERELIYPYFRLLEEGYEVHLVGTEKETNYISKSGLSEKSTHSSKEISAKDYDGVIIPGGFSPDYMRRCKYTVDFVKDMDKENKLIAAICHGPWMMASSCNLKGRKVTSFFSIKDDLINAGADYLDEEVVVDGNLITSRTPKDLPVFLKKIIEKLNEN